MIGRVSPAFMPPERDVPDGWRRYSTGHQGTMWLSGERSDQETRYVRVVGMIEGRVWVERGHIRNGILVAVESLATRTGFASEVLLVWMNRHGYREEMAA